MKIAYFPKQTALQSEPVWSAFLNGMKPHGWTPVENSLDADAAVIWSVLWKGRMLANKQVYDHYRQQGKPVFIIEVGTLKRGVTWKVSLNNITNDGIYPTLDIDPGRPDKLGLSLAPIRQSRRPTILIATQHSQSLQWEGMPSVEQWLTNTIQSIRLHTDRDIVVRSHPRAPVQLLTSYKSVTFEQPIKIPNTYDVYDIDFNHHCVINYCSGPSIQAPIAGTPVICGSRSLAYPVSTSMNSIDTPKLPDREEWFVNLCHTEWTIDEIDSGIPQKNLLLNLTL